MKPHEKMMKYISHQQGQDVDDLVIDVTQIPTPEPHQVLVKVEAFGINRADTLQRQGKYPPPKGESTILGLEVSGTIVHTGELVRGFACGDGVFGLVAGGGYAEYVAVDPRHLMKIPKGMSYVLAASIAEVYLTAYQSLFSLSGLKPKEKVLIHAGASGVGQAAIQLAKSIHCQVAVTVSTTEKCEFCRSVGADIQVNYLCDDFVTVLKALDFLPDVIVDVVAGTYFNRNLDLVNLDGRIVYLAMLNGRFTEPVDMAKLLSKRVTIKGSTLRNRSDDYKATLIEDFSLQCLAGFENGTFDCNVTRSFPATDISSTHLALEKNQSIGKMVGYW